MNRETVPKPVYEVVGEFRDIHDTLPCIWLMIKKKHSLVLAVLVALRPRV